MVTVTQRPREQGPTDTVLAYPKHFLGQQVAVYIHARAHTHTHDYPEHFGHLGRDTQTIRVVRIK